MPGHAALAALSALLLCAFPAPALSAHPTSAPEVDVPSRTAARAACDEERDPHGALLAIRDALAGMPDVEAARRVVLPYGHAVQRALGAARWAAPWSDGLRAADERMADFRGEVLAASDARTVAEAFAGLVRIAPEPAGGAALSDVGTAAGGDTTRARPALDFEPKACSYSTGEVIAIVLGFILGIIPGIILLILLC